MPESQLHSDVDAATGAAEKEAADVTDETSGFADEADDECRVGQNVGLIGDTHDRQLTADTRYEKSDPQPPERLVSPQRGDIRQEGLHTEV